MDLGLKVYKNTLYQPYQEHLTRNSSIIINGITQKVGNSTYALNMVLTLTISGLLIITIAATLFVINPSVALVASVSFGGGYVVVGALFRKLLVRNSKVVAYNSTKLIQCIQEGIGGIRDILLDGSQPIYSENYSRISLPLARARAKNSIYAGCPRYVMEALGMSLIAALAYTLSQQPDGMLKALPMLGALALAAQRLLPNLQQVFAAWAGITGNKVSLMDTIELLDRGSHRWASRRRPVACRFIRRQGRQGQGYISD